MPTTAHRWNRFLHYIPWLGHSLRNRVQLLLCKIDCCMNVIDRNKEAVSYRKFWKHYLLKEIDSEKGRELQEVWKHYLLETIDSKKEFVSCKKCECIIYRGNRVEERDSQQEGRWNTPKLCPNYAIGSKNSGIEKS